MTKATGYALLLLAVPAFADDPPDFLRTFLYDLGHTAETDNGFGIGADMSVRKDYSRHFRFTTIPSQYTGSARLEILLEPLKGETLEPMAFTFDYDGIDYPITDYVYHSGNHYTVYLPDLKQHTKFEFTLGLKNYRFHTYDVTALLTTDNGQKSAAWHGSKR